jgi:hypothetical protein
MFKISLYQKSRRTVVRESRRTNGDEFGIREDG